MSVERSTTNKEPFVLAKDTIDNSVKRIATTTDLQVGTINKPAELMLTGRLSFACRTITLTMSHYETIYVSNDDTAITINEPPAGYVGSVNVVLPDNPRIGQIHVIKDGVGFAATYNVIVSSSTSTIDGAASQVIDANFGTLLLVWSGDDWKRLVAITGGGGAPTSATYVTLTTNSSLTNERTLAVTAGHLSITDGGAGNAVTLSLSNTAVSPGSYTAANITVDQQGRLTAVSSGGASFAPLDPSYIVITNDATLTNDRALSVVTSDLALIDNGAGNNVSLGLATVIGVVGTYANPSSVTVDDRGRVTAVSTLGYTPANLNAAYVTIGGDGTLTNDRALSTDPGSGIKINDLGANSFVKLFTDNNVLATISGSTYTGPVLASTQYGFTGSLSRLRNNQQFIVGSPASFMTVNAHDTVAGPYFAVSSSKPFDNEAAYIVLGVTSSLVNERSLTAGVGISFTDNGPGNTLEINYTGATVIPADYYASYLVLSATSSLQNERAINIGDGLRYTDGGAGGNYLVRIDNGIVATLSGSAFSGRISLLPTSDIIAAASKGITGSITKIWTGTNYFNATPPFGITIADPPENELIPYIIGLGSITVTTGAYGQIQISTFGIGADDAASYIVLSATSSLANERVLTEGFGINITDGGPGGTVVISADTASYDELYASKQAQYVVVNTTASLPNERALTAGTNISIQDNGPGSTLVINNTGTSDAEARYLLHTSTTGSLSHALLLYGGGLANTDVNNPFSTQDPAFVIQNNMGFEPSGIYVKFYDSVLATITGSTFTGPISASHVYGITGSITKLSTGQDYLKAGAGIELTTSSLGQITITSLTGNPGADQDASFLLVQATGSIVNARIVASQSGIRITDAGPGNTMTFSVDNGVVATLSGSTYSGPVIVDSLEHGFTGSLTQLSNGTSYLVAGQNISIFSASNGQVLINTPNHADVAASYVVLSSTGSLQNERVLAAGSNISIQDNGPGNTLVINTLVSPGTGASVPMHVMQMLAGNAITTVADEDAKQTVGMLYFRPGIITAFSGSSTFYFRNIVQTSSTDSWVAMDLYDVNGIVTGIPGIVSGSIMSSSLETATWKSNVLSALETVTGSGILESRMWRISGSVSQCFSSTIEVEFS